MTRGAVIVGALVVGLAAGQGARDVAWGVSHWSRLGPLRPGESMPQFAVPMLSGGRFDTQALAGKVSVVTFWATWCPACRDELGTLDELDDEYVGRPDVQFMAVDHEGGMPPREAARAVSAFAADRDLRLPVAIDDGAMARAFRVGPIPHTVILDREGTIRHVHQGRVTAGTIRDEVDALLRE